MFGIGMQELAVILVIALLVFGPKRLPELARSMGRGLAEFRRASTDLRRTLNEATEDPRALAGADEAKPPADEAPPAEAPPDEGAASSSEPEADGSDGSPETARG